MKIPVVKHQKSTLQLHDNQNNLADWDHGSAMPGSRLTGLSFFLVIAFTGSANKANKRKARHQFCAKSWLAAKATSRIMCESIPTTSIPPPPRANPGHLLHDESLGPSIWQLIVSRPPGDLQTTKKLSRNILSPFPTPLRVKGFKQSSTVILE